MARTLRYGRPGLGDQNLTVNFNPSKILRITDRVTGYFVGGGMQRALAEVHEAAALQVQVGMVEELKKKVAKTGRRQGPRPQGTGALEASLLDPRNTEVTASAFSVLRPAWMEQSPAALYWRRIEEGDQTTFNAYILFTNDMMGGRRYGPWSPAGTRANGRRANPTAPPGYKHMRMPQGRGALVMNIGPYPAYEYTDGGKRALRRFPFRAQYKASLASVGINISNHLRK